MSGVIASAGLMLSRYDADMKSIFERMSTAPSSDLARKLDTFMRAIKDAGVWALLDTLVVPVKGETEQARLLDWRRSAKSYTLSGANAATNSTYGFEVGASSYVDSDYNPAADAVIVSQNSHTVFAWVTKLPDWSGGPMWNPVWQRAGNTALLRTYDFDYRLNARANNAEMDTTAGEATLSSSELFAVCRNTSTTCALYKGSASVKTSSTASSAWSGILESSNLRILELDASVDVSGGVGVFGMGGYMDSTKLAALKTAIQALVA